MKQRAADLVSAINVTPLVDVCLVLLIIFMVVTPLMVNGPVDLPESSTATMKPEHEKQLAVIVKADGTLLIGSTIVRAEQLRSELERQFTSKPGAEVVVRADGSAKYSAVLEVLRECRSAGFHEIGIIARRPAESA